MQVTVDPELCIACGACIDISPELFEWNEEGLAEATREEIPAEIKDEALEAVESCPTDAIIKK